MVGRLVAEAGVFVGSIGWLANGADLLPAALTTTEAVSAFACDRHSFKASPEGSARLFLTSASLSFVRLEGSDLLTTGTDEEPS